MRLRYKHSDEAKAKIAEANRSRAVNAETKAKLSAAMRLRYEDHALRERIAAAQPDQRGELSISWKGDDVGTGAAHIRAKQALADQPCAHEDETCSGALQCAFNHDTPDEFAKVDGRSELLFP